MKGLRPSVVILGTSDFPFLCFCSASSAAISEGFSRLSLFHLGKSLQGELRSPQGMGWSPDLCHLNCLDQEAPIGVRRMINRQLKE